MDEEFIMLEDLLPDGAIPVSGVRIITYMSPTGGTAFRYDHTGDGAISDLIGILEMIKHDITSAAIIAAKGQRND